MPSLFAGVCLLPLLGQLDQQIADPTIDRQELRLAVAELRTLVIDQKKNPVAKLGLPLELELERLVSLPAAALLMDVSEDTLERHLGKYIVNIGPKRRGMRLKHALMLEPVRLPLQRRKRKAATQPRRAVSKRGSKRTTDAMAEAP
jgi:hypothetical protein